MEEISSSNSVDYTVTWYSVESLGLNQKVLFFRLLPGCVPSVGNLGPSISTEVMNIDVYSIILLLTNYSIGIFNRTHQSFLSLSLPIKLTFPLCFSLMHVLQGGGPAQSAVLEKDHMFDGWGVGNHIA